jgi:outer membrane protein OmpA-like peptidoglycan-associated protein
LKTARDAYAKVSTSDAAKENPATTRDAQQAMEAAEKAHLDDAGSEAERSYAYVATRKAQLATARAEELQAREDRAMAEQAYQAQLQRELSSARQEAQAQELASAKAQKELQGWRKRGEDLVITLSGVLFDTGNHELTSDARKRLDVVVHAIKERPDRNLTVAGYTDSTGRDETNRALSQKRADVVKAYIQKQGVPASRITSVGHGEEDAVASNDTPEGRSENRRVEITLHRAGALPERQPVKGTDPEPLPTGKSKSKSK